LIENYLNLTPARKEAVTKEIGDYMGALEGKVAIVTGGNSGIGLATAKRFAEEGAYVFITARRQSELDKAVAEIGRNVTAIAGDLAKLEDIGKIAETVKAEKGVVDIIVSNAGFT
jgi:NAD(P)-dependent dehydrogenase (short-subunit alcohol dehydrogenase family)